MAKSKTEVNFMEHLKRCSPQAVTQASWRLRPRRLADFPRRTVTSWPLSRSLPSD